MTALVGGIGGFALSPLLTYAVTLMRAEIALLPLVALSAGSSLLFAPSLVAARLLRRPGVALGAALWSGAVLALTTAFPVDSAASMLSCGLLAEGAIALGTRYRRFTRASAAVTGGLLGGLVCAINLLGHQLTLPPIVLMTLLVATLGGFMGMAVLSFTGARQGQAYQ